MTARRLRQDFDHAIRVAAQSDFDGNLDPAQPVGKRPIDDFGPDQLAVWDDDVGAVEGVNKTRSETDLSHDAVGRPDLDVVSDLHGMLEYQDETGNKVVYDVLQ